MHANARKLNMLKQAITNTEKVALNSPIQPEHVFEP